MKELQQILGISCQEHDHLCPRQILGARIGMAGLTALGFTEAPGNKRLLVILETDGCFADGVIAAAECTVGHRTLRVEDFGKTAATFVDTRTRKAVRVAPRVDARAQAERYAPEQPTHYLAQMEAYQSMPTEALLTIAEVLLDTPLEQILSRPGIRTVCMMCGEEILNERELERDGLVLCRTCAGQGYYRQAPALRADACVPVTYLDGVPHE